MVVILTPEKSGLILDLKVMVTTMLKYQKYLKKKHFDNNVYLLNDTI